MTSPEQRIETAARTRDEAVEELLDAIRDGANSGLTIAAIARAARMSRTHVRRIIEAR